MVLSGLSALVVEEVADRQALCGTLLVLHTGIQWEYLPEELGFGTDGQGIPLAVSLTGGDRGRRHPVPAPAGQGSCGIRRRRATTQTTGHALRGPRPRP
ncbi:hypothetical protein GCM10010266_69010 [Streptomyces griseomycini]|nr:hypothetical protein GCM10010266_69010 [Streptomyces griseomycini]GGR54011.1 hypothetical protein GCM10015536_69260 [Streptomyces griseomycini]